MAQQDTKRTVFSTCGKSEPLFNFSLAVVFQLSEPTCLLRTTHIDNIDNGPSQGAFPY